MTDYIYLIFATFCSSALSVIASLYNRKNARLANVYKLYPLLLSIGALISWGVFYALDFSFDVKVLLYSLIYGICFTLATTGLISALKSGPTMITEYVKSLSLIFVSVWGFIFWQEPFTLLVGIGLVLIAIALFLCLSKRKNEFVIKNTKPITLKWAFFCLILLSCNAGCSIIKKYQQMEFNKQHGMQFMFFASIIAVIVAFVLSLKEDKTNWKTAIKKTWYLPMLSGLSSATLNYLYLILFASSISTSVIFPVIAVGGLAITITVSFFVFKERLSTLQWIGIFIGGIAVALLNI